MKTLSLAETNMTAGGCFQTPDGDWFDLIEVAPGIFMPVPCNRPLQGPSTTPPRGRNPAPWLEEGMTR